MISGISDVVVAATTDPATSSAAHTIRIRLGPYMSPSLPSTGVATAPVSSVAVMAHDALAGLVDNSVGSCGMSGITSVCMSETLIPAPASAATRNPAFAGRPTSTALRLGILIKVNE